MCEERERMYEERERERERGNDDVSEPYIDMTIKKCTKTS